MSAFKNVPVFSDTLHRYFKTNSSDSVNQVRDCFKNTRHAALELIYIHYGDMRVTVNNTVRDCHEGDLLIFNLLDCHYGCICKELPEVKFSFAVIDLDYFRLQLRNNAVSVIDDLCESRIRFYNYVKDCPVTRRIGESLKEISDIFNSEISRGSDLLMISDVYRIIGMLADNGCVTGISSDERKSDIFMRKVLNFLETNYKNQITPKMLYAEFPYNRSYFCRLFKRNFGMPFLSYLCKFRIYKSISLYMCESAEPISVSEISARTGFSSYCRYSKDFRRYMGKTPSEYMRIEAENRRSRD